MPARALLRVRGDAGRSFAASARRKPEFFTASTAYAMQRTQSDLARRGAAGLVTPQTEILKENVMPRKGPVPKREVLPDPLYNSRLVTKFVNRLMYDGKKGAAEKIFYSSLASLAEKTGEDPMRAFEKALDNVKPHLEVKARRVGGATYQVPMEVRPDRQVSLSIRWLINYARSRGEKGMTSKLSAELLDAYNGRGGAVKKREDTHRMAEANKAFAHYRW